VLDATCVAQEPDLLLLFVSQLAAFGFFDRHLDLYAFQFKNQEKPRSCINDSLEVKDRESRLQHVYHEQYLDEFYQEIGLNSSSLTNRIFFTV